MAFRAQPLPWRAAVVPALLTLAVTILRLTGEMLGWNPSLFNREAGGGGALVGIVWLIPVFGAAFGWRLAAADHAPKGRAALWALCALVFNTAAGFAAFALFANRPVAQLASFTVTSWIALALAWRGWPELWRVLLAYGVLARVPVVAIMFLAIFLGWDTHYAKPRPDFPPMGPWGLFFWTALLPQLSVWMYLTVAGGMLFGAGAAALRGWRGRGPAGQPRSAA